MYTQTQARISTKEKNRTGWRDGQSWGLLSYTESSHKQNTLCYSNIWVEIWSTGVRLQIFKGTAFPTGQQQVQKPWEGSRLVDWMLHKQQDRGAGEIKRCLLGVAHLKPGRPWKGLWLLLCVMENHQTILNKEVRSLCHALKDHFALWIHHRGKTWKGYHGLKCVLSKSIYWFLNPQYYGIWLTRRWGH